MDLDKEIVYAFLTIILTVVTWLIRQRVANEKLDVKSKEYLLLQMLVGTAVEATEQVANHDVMDSDEKLLFSMDKIKGLAEAHGININPEHFGYIALLIEQAVLNMNKE